MINIYNNTSIYSVGGAKLTNAGTIDKYGSGTAVIGAPLVDTGTISVAAGYLRLSGATSTLGGTITGAGSLELNTGTDTISAGTTLSIGGIYADGATVVMSGAETYAGILTLTSGTLNLGAPTFTLSGTGNFEGGVVIGTGTLALAGATTIGGLVVEGSETVSNTGSMTQVGNWYVGYNSGDAIKFVNQASGTLRITAGSQIYGTAGSSFTNAGVTSKTGVGTSQIAVATINTGTVNVASGAMSFAAAVSGAGTIAMGSGTTLSFAGAVAAGGHVSMAADATLNANTTAGFGDAIANFTAGDVISLNGLGYRQQRVVHVQYQHRQAGRHQRELRARRSFSRAATRPRISCCSTTAAPLPSRIADADRAGDRGAAPRATVNSRSLLAVIP